MDDLQALSPLVLLVGATLGPYLVERFRFGVRFGVFAVLFWLFAAQCGLIVAGALVVQVLGFDSPVGRIAGTIAGFAFLPIGLIPFVILPIAVVAVGAAYAWRQWARH
ncbi:MAG: hypothetical protein AB7I79_17765 [Rhizobiaceae bacterium]